MDIVDLAIHQVVVCQKSDFHNSSDIRNSQKPDPLQMTEKNIRPKLASLSKIFWFKKLAHGTLQR
jgi:hypothetical protein